MARATSSLPTPVSPQTRTVASVSATWSIISLMAFMRGLFSKTPSYSERRRSSCPRSTCVAELLHFPLQRGLFLLAREGPWHAPGRLIVADDDQLGRPGSGRTAELDRVEQHLTVERLAQVRGGTGSPDSLGGRRIVMGGDRSRGYRPRPPPSAPEARARSSPRDEIQDQAGRTGERRCVEKLTGRGERVDGIARRLDQASEGPTDRQIVVDDGDQRTVGHGVIALECECGGPAPRAPVDFGPLVPEPEGG